MSILIEGMEMPKSCDECPLLTEDGDYNVCFVGKRRVMWEWKHDRGSEVIHPKPDWCPLVPVPPHGRLIDADELISDFEDGMEFIRSTCQNVEYKHLYCLIADGMIELMKKYRTVIPSNREGNGRRSEV